MRTTLVMASVLTAALAAAEQKLLDVPWLESLPEGVERSPDGSLTVTSTSEEGMTVTLAEVASPGITKARYAVRGQVRYEDIDGHGYVEMWNVFPDGRYFTRTNAEQGPLRALTGSSDWRALVLPFDWTAGTDAPERLIINVVLPGRGVVSLSPLTLVELEAGDPLFRGSAAAAGLWGGIAGAVLGTIGGLLGWLGGRGKAKRLVLSGFRFIMLFGGVALLLGVLSLIRGLPYHVYYPWLLLGAVALLVPASTLPRLRKRYQELELRRMSALDA